MILRHYALCSEDELDFGYVVKGSTFMGSKLVYSLIDYVLQFTYTKVNKLVYICKG